MINALNFHKKGEKPLFKYERIYKYDKALVILSVSEVSINLKCDFSALRRILNFVDFSLSSESSK